MYRILIIQDELQFTKVLKLDGFETEYASSFKEAWLKISTTNHYDLLLMDTLLPDGSGIDLCQKVRESGNEVPIIFLSALTDETTALKCIQSGADDYLRKPLGLEELKLRINKFIKKITPHIQMITFGELTIYPSKRNVILMGELLTMGKKEINILTLLTKRAGEIVTRESIIESIYDHPDLFDRTIDSHISHLRKKIKKIAGIKLQISSIYGLGYRLEWKAS